MGKKCEKINGDLTIILVYMNGGFALYLWWKGGFMHGKTSF